MFRNPIVLGGGTPFLPPVTKQIPLELIENKTFDRPYGINFEGMAWDGKQVRQATQDDLAVRQVSVRTVAEGPLRGKAHRAILRGMALGSQRRTDLLRGALDLCLLAVMDEGPAYGYEMTKRLRDRGLATVGEGSIYPLLGRLEREGLVETYRTESRGGPQRKYYKPSNAGRLALALGVSEWRATRDAIDAVLDSVKVEVAS